MSWHARWGRKDPHERTVKVGEEIGTWRVLGLARKDPHYGVVVWVQCARCGSRQQRIQTKIRHDARNGRKTHRGCTEPTT